MVNFELTLRWVEPLNRGLASRGALGGSMGWADLTVFRHALIAAALVLGGVQPALAQDQPEVADDHNENCPCVEQRDGFRGRFILSNGAWATPPGSTAPLVAAINMKVPAGTTVMTSVGGSAHIGLGYDTDDGFDECEVTVPELHELIIKEVDGRYCPILASFAHQPPPTPASGPGIGLGAAIIIPVLGLPIYLVVDSIGDKNEDDPDS